MIQASQFVPIGYVASVVGFDLTRSVGRLAARLLSTYGDLIDDEIGVHVPSRKATLESPLFLPFRDAGLLTVTPAWARFEGGLATAPWVDPEQEPKPISWAVELLMAVLSVQKQVPQALQFEMTWLLDGHSTPAALAEYFGLSRSLNGFFTASTEFEIHGNATTELPDLFSVDFELTAGLLGDYEEPDNVGLQLKYWGPDNRVGTDPPVNYTRDVVDRFFATAPQRMGQQVEQYFPAQGQTR